MSIIKKVLCIFQITGVLDLPERIIKCTVWPHPYGSINGQTKPRFNPKPQIDP